MTFSETARLRCAADSVCTTTSETLAMHFIKGRFRYLRSPDKLFVQIRTRPTAFCQHFHFSRLASIPLPTRSRPSTHNLGTPHLFQYNLTIEQQLPGSIGLSVSYVNTRGIHLFTEAEADPFQGSTFVNGNPVWYKFVCGGVPSALTGTGCVANNGQVPGIAAYQRLNPAWNTIVLDTPDSSSSYNGLQVVVNKRITHGLEFQSAYTWSNSLDLSQGQGYNTTADPPRCPPVSTPSMNFMIKARPARTCATIGASTCCTTSLLSQETVPVEGGEWLVVGTIYSQQTGYPFSAAEATNNRSLSGLFFSKVPLDRANVNTAASIAANPCTHLHEPVRIYTSSL